MTYTISHETRISLARAANIAILLLGLLFSSLDASIVYTSLLTISLDLHEFVKSPWVVISYLLAFVSLAIPFAKASDIWGRRRLLIWAWALFTVGSLGSGLATSIDQLIFFRATQGSGGSGLYSLAQVGLFEVGPTHRPQLLGGCIAITLAISFVLGPVLGGTITAFATWRWIFYINIPIGIAAIIVLMFAWTHNISHHSSDYRGSQVWHVIDTWGILLSTAASSMIVCSLATLGTKSSALPISFSLAIMGVLSGIAFVVWEIWLGCSRHRFPETEPMIPLRLIRNRIYVGASLCCWFTGWIYLSVLVILPERFQIVNREGPLIAGVHLLPMLGTTAFGSFLAGTICKKRNVTALILILAQTLQAVGVALFLTMRSTDAEVKAQNGYQVILGLGIGLSFGSTTMLTQKLVPSAHLAVGQGLMAQMRVFGGAMGIAVCSIVYNWTTDARSEYFNASDIELIKNSPVVQQFLPPHLQELTRQNFVESFNKDIMIIFVVGLVGALFSLLTLDRTLFSQRFARHEESHNNMMRGAIELQSRDSN